MHSRGGKKRRISSQIVWEGTKRFLISSFCNHFHLNKKVLQHISCQVLTSRQRSCLVQIVNVCTSLWMSLAPLSKVKSINVSSSSSHLALLLTEYKWSLGSCSSRDRWEEDEPSARVSVWGGQTSDVSLSTSSPLFRIFQSRVTMMHVVAVCPKSSSHLSVAPSLL